MKNNFKSISYEITFHFISEEKKYFYEYMKKNVLKSIVKYCIYIIIKLLYINIYILYIEIYFFHDILTLKIKHLCDTDSCTFTIMRDVHII